MIRTYDMATGNWLDPEQIQPTETSSHLGRSADALHPTLQLQEIPLKSRKAPVQIPHDLATKSIDSFISKQK